MKDHLTPNCDPSAWTELDQMTKLKMEIQASLKPSFFWAAPEMGNHPLWPAQAEIIDQFYEKDENGKRKYNELLFDAGRQGGKTYTAAFILCTELYRLLMLKSPHQYYNISRARDITLFMSAAGLKQTLATIYPTVRNLLELSPYFCQYADAVNVTSGVMRFPKKITIEAVGSNIKTAVGRTVKAYIAEEVNSVGTEAGMLTPGEQYHKLSKSTTMFIPFGEDVRVAISSRTSGYDFLSQTIQNAKESNLKRTLIIQKDIVQLNPNITKEFLEEERLRDEDSYNMEFGLGEALTGLRFFKPFVLDRIKFTKKNLFTIPGPRDNLEFVPDYLPENFEFDSNSSIYMLGLDPSTIHDPFGISVVHYTLDDQVIIDGASCFMSGKGVEINPILVKSVVMKILNNIPINYCFYDIGLYNETRAEIEGRGIKMVKNIVKLEDFVQFKDQCIAGLVTCPDEDYIKREIKELIIRNNKVDHPPSGTKDVLDAIVNCAAFKFREVEDQMPTMKYFSGLTCSYR